MKRTELKRSSVLPRNRKPLDDGRWPDIYKSPRGGWYFHGSRIRLRWWRPSHVAVMWRHKMWERRFW